MSMFQKAKRTAARLRIGLIGPSGSGKTLTALRIARGLGSKIAVIDTEHGSASLYAGEKVPEGDLEFDTLALTDHHPAKYVEAIRAAGQAGYDVLIIDSLTHAWTGSNGALELKDQAARRNKGGNDFTAWRDITPLHNALIEAILASPCHVIGTMRSKTEYVLEEDGRGKKVPRKVGMAPVQRDGMEYEFTVVGELDVEHHLMVSKTRCRALDGAVIRNAGGDVANTLLAWLDGAEEPPVVGVPVDPKADLIRASRMHPDELDEFVFWVRNIRLATMPVERLAAMVEWLATPAGQARLAAFRQGPPADQAPAVDPPKQAPPVPATATASAQPAIDAAPPATDPPSREPTPPRAPTRGRAQAAMAGMP